MLGIGTSYVGQSNDYHEIEDDVLIDVLAALGVDASSDEAIERSINAIAHERYGRLVAPTVLHTAGTTDHIRVNTSIMSVPTASITLENGEPYEGTLAVVGDGSQQAHIIDGRFIASALVEIPDDVPVGYHTLHVSVDGRTQDATLISAPSRVELPESLKSGQLWGWMAQLYSIRSAGSWGVGDFEDLKTLLVDAKRRTGADFVLINPMHAAEPVSPLTPSPYLPVSRRFVNFTYIRPESIEEYRTADESVKAQINDLHDGVAALNGDPQIIDRDTMWRAKMHALWILFKVGRNEARQAEFEAFKQSCGEELEAYATWCLCYDKWGAPSEDLNNWERSLTKDSPQIADLRNQFPDTLDFYRWMEWVATQQFRSAQEAAKEAGMQIGVMADMAVGVHPLGCDVWWNPERFAKGATVGAPPDFFNQQGQNWRTTATAPTATSCMVCSPSPAPCGSTTSSVCSACGGSRRASPPRRAPTSTTIRTSCWASWPSRPPVSAAWWSARTLAWCRSTWPIRWPNTGCWAAPSNGSSRPTACSMSPGPGARTRWRR